MLCTYTGPSCFVSVRDWISTRHTTQCKKWWSWLSCESTQDTHTCPPAFTSNNTWTKVHGIYVQCSFSNHLCFCYCCSVGSGMERNTYLPMYHWGGTNHWHLVLVVMVTMVFLLQLFSHNIDWSFVFLKPLCVSLPLRRDLPRKQFWNCDDCGYVGVSIYLGQ